MKRGIGILIGIGVYAAAVCVSLTRDIVPWKRHVLVSVCEPTTAQTLEMPCDIGLTGLVAEKLTTYEGPFLEDGSYEEVVDVAALIVRNATDTMLETVKIGVDTSDTRLQFTGTWLPPGGTCVLLEQNRAMYSYEPVLSIQGECATAKNAVSDSGLVFSEETDGIHITNTSPQEVGKIRLRYKTYLLQTEYYMGGITNTVSLDGLAAGETAVVFPPYYVKDYSKVIMMEIDE